MGRPDPWKKTGTYSLIYDLEGDSPPIRATATFDLGTVINRLSRDWVIIGSGEILGAKEIFKGEEIRCLVVRRDDLATVRKVFKDWLQKDSKLEPEKEMVLKGILETKDASSPVINNENDETLISILVDDIALQARFTKENLKFIQGIDINQPASLRGIEIYVLGHLIQNASQQWEILGRALLPAKD
jgi:hypothetical protein